MDYCAECTYLRPEDYKGNCNGLYYCEKRYDYVLGNNPKCGNFCRAYSRNDYQIRDVMYKGEQENNSSNSSCYLTTLISYILGYNDNGYILNTLRNFRKNVLQTNQEYKQLLVEYDIIGPKIAYLLANDSNRDMIAKNLYDNILIKIIIELEKGNYETAIKLYKGMTYGLQICYGLTNIKIDPALIQARNSKEAGYGKRKVLQK